MCQDFEINFRWRKKLRSAFLCSRHSQNVGKKFHSVSSSGRFSSPSVPFVDRLIRLDCSFFCYICVCILSLQFFIILFIYLFTYLSLCLLAPTHAHLYVHMHLFVFLFVSLCQCRISFFSSLDRQSASQFQTISHTFSPFQSSSPSKFPFLKPPLGR